MAAGKDRNVHGIITDLGRQKESDGGDGSDGDGSDGGGSDEESDDEWIDFGRIINNSMLIVHMFIHSH